MTDDIARLRSEVYRVMLETKYAYNFTWYGRPIIQMPQDIVAVQELVLGVKPDLIVETGVARGGSLLLSASMLELLGRGRVIGIDIDIRDDARTAIEQHPLASRIELIEGSSVEDSVVEKVGKQAESASCTMVLLDSDHTHDHVLAELRAYAPLVTTGSYAVVFDTVIEDLPADAFPDRAWGPGNNPRTAVDAYLGETDRFEVDADLEARLLFTAAPGGFLRCVK